MIPVSRSNPKFAKLLAEHPRELRVRDTGLKLAFRKRVLKPGSSIGYHLQKEDEIYYIESGTGIMKINNDSFTVKKGDAVLTRPGSSHGLQQTGKDELVVIINYPAE